MKQSVPAPIAIVITVVVVGVIGYFLWSHYMAEPSVATSSGAANKTAHAPTSKEEGRQMYPGHP